MGNNRKFFKPVAGNGTGNYSDKIDSIAKQRLELEAHEAMVIDKALHSNNPQDVIKAMQAVKIKPDQNHNERKSVLLDPNDFTSANGYKEVKTRVNFATLARMSKTPIINAIIKTRMNQVAQFSSPQSDRFSTGFRITKKGVENQHELSKKERKEIDEITEYIINCGINQSWSRDNFEQYLRKLTQDSLVYDQGTHENVFTKSGKLFEFYATDGSTMRITDEEEMRKKAHSRFANYDMVGGYVPKYIQVIDTQIKASFFPWELAWVMRNPTTSIYSNGYGRSELEDMVQIVTNMLNSDTYNANFFKQGASPKGMLRIKGGTHNPRVSEFRREWKSMVSGVQNSWKTPILDADSMEWIDLQKNNRDMEYSNWHQYLIKLGCALYAIDPREIGFSMQDHESGGTMFESSNEQKIKYSKDKGLKPILKSIEYEFQKKVIDLIAPDYKFEFVGLESETPQEFRERTKTEVETYRTVNEIREELNLEAIEGGDIILNPTYIQAKQQEAMMNQMGDEGGEMPPEMQGQQGGDEEEEAEEYYKATEENPFWRDYENMIEKMEHGEI